MTGRTFPAAFKAWLLQVFSTCPHAWELVLAGVVDYDGEHVFVRLDQCRLCKQTQIRGA
jgi:hypothetical protein